MSIRVAVPKSGFLQGALVLLVVTAFGCLSVAIPLLLAGLGPRQSFVPTTFAAWGVASLVGAYGVWRVRRWAPWVVVPTQAAAALGLAYAYVVVAPEPTLLLVAAISGGAAALVIADVRRRRRGR